jgi:hypothetical protein
VRVGSARKASRVGVEEATELGWIVLGAEGTEAGFIVAGGEEARAFGRNIGV